MNFKNKVFLFWGCMDALLIISYLYKCISLDAIPLDYEIERMIYVWELDLPLYTLSSFANIVLLLSIVLSCALFLSRKKMAIIVALVQAPLRFMFVVPSIWLFGLGVDWEILIIWLVASEMLKCFTLFKVVNVIKNNSND